MIIVEKKFLRIALVCILGMMFLVTGCQDSSSEISWNTYENQYFQMDYPASWSYEEVEGERMVAVLFEEEGEDFIFEMSVTPIESWLEEEEKLEMMKDFAIEQSEIEGFEIEEKKEIEIGGITGFRIVDQQEGRGIRSTMATVFNYQQLAINFAGSEEGYQQHIEVAEEVIESIELFAD